MCIGIGIIIFISGCSVGYMICMTSWVKEISREGNDIQMEIDRLTAKLKGEEDGNDR